MICLECGVGELVRYSVMPEYDLYVCSRCDNYMDVEDYDKVVTAALEEALENI